LAEIQLNIRNKSVKSVKSVKDVKKYFFRGTKIFPWDRFFPVNMNMNLLGTIHPREMNDNEPTSPSPSSHPIA